MSTRKYYPSSENTISETASQIKILYVNMPLSTTLNLSVLGFSEP
jgi:hypothetical protein